MNFLDMALETLGRMARKELCRDSLHSPSQVDPGTTQPSGQGVDAGTNGGVDAEDEEEEWTF